MRLLQMDASLASHYVNDGFSGGEKKWVEDLHPATIQPQMAVLDETCVGLDIDLLRIVAQGITLFETPAWTFCPSPTTREC